MTSRRISTCDDGPLALDDCLALWLPGATPCAADGRWLARVFPDRLWIAVELLTGGQDRRRLALLEALGRELALPLVAAGDVHMHVRGRRALQDVVTATRLRITVERAGLALYPNGERHLRPLPRLCEIYPAGMIEATLAIAARCRFSLDELRYEYPHEIVPDGETPSSWLRRLTLQGMQSRWPAGVPAQVAELVEHELALIAELRFDAYFLTVHDIVSHARSLGILCQGRGSAANSAVCYCLGVTEVDPGRMSLLFERFISRERNEPPDIDVDFEHERREEVIQYVYSKYGRGRAALTATVICYRPRSALRDVAKALGLDALQVEALARSMQWWDGSSMDAGRVREAGLDPESPVLARVLALARSLLGFPRHLSQHVGGFVISRGPLAELVPVENAAMADRTVIQWDKDDLDALGLLKVDVLGLGMLSAIRRSFDLIERHRGTRLTLATVPAEDPPVYEMIRHADTMGVFQIESRAQMAMLPRLRPESYYDLVIEVAIVRPGPIQGDMVHPYLRRRNREEPVSYPSPEVEGVLKRTLGVPIFQEQVMQLAVVAAGFTPGEADSLRRAMAAWKRKGGLGPFEDRLIRGMRERGYSERFRAADLPADPRIRRVRVSGMRRRRDARGGRGYRALADHRRDRLRSRSPGKYARMRRSAAHAKAQGARRSSERREAGLAVAYGAGPYDYCDGRASVHDDGWLAPARETAGWRLRRSSAINSGPGSSPLAAPSDPCPCRSDRRGQSVSPELRSISTRLPHGIAMIS